MCNNVSFPLIRAGQIPDREEVPILNSPPVSRRCSLMEGNFLTGPPCGGDAFECAVHVDCVYPRNASQYHGTAPEWAACWCCARSVAHGGKCGPVVGPLADCQPQPQLEIVDGRS